MARAVHGASARANKPLVTVNCAALAENLLESELFGHERGAFTGADRRREGRFLQADGGTLFLDEIGEMPLSLQAKLLRALQQGEVQRVGSDSPITVDVRVIAATNRNLREEVEQKRFREDLFFRLNVISIEVPALRERSEDIPLLAAHFLEKFAARNRKNVKGFAPQALDMLRRYSWPGNVRELQNAVERAVILCTGDLITGPELPASVTGAAEQAAPETAPEQAAAPETNAEAADPKKKDGFFNKKAREMEAVKAKLDAAEKNAAQAKEQLLRMAAEYDNYRKRSTREADQKFNDGISFAVNQIIPILDTLDMAANAPTTDENYKKGVVMTLDKAAKALEALHVEEIEALGKPFDPNFMNAVQQIPAPDGQESGTVITVYQKGYRLGDKIVRHATVVVAE